MQIYGYHEANLNYEPGEDRNLSPSPFQHSERIVKAILSHSELGTQAELRDTSFLGGGHNF